MSRTNKTAFNRILSIVLTIMMIIAMVPINVLAVDDFDYGTVDVYTGGTIYNNGTANVEVVIDETTLQWVEGNVARNEGWWVGISVTAPEVFSDDATYKSKGNPSHEYGDAKSFAEKKDGENVIQMWFPVSPETLIRFANEGRNITMMYAFDWNADGDYEQEITFSVVPSGKIVLMKGDKQEYPYSVEFGTVSTFTGGDVNNNGTKNVEVVIEETTLHWVEGNTLRKEGWWVGVKAIAPVGVSSNATYKSKGNPSHEYGAAKKFSENKDGENYIELWFPVSSEDLVKFANENRNITMMYTFDWNGDAVYEQELTFSVVPSEKIVLMKDSEQIYPIPKYDVTVSTNVGGTVELNNDTDGSVTVERGADVAVSVKAEAGYWIESVKVGNEDKKIATGSTEYSTIISGVSADVEVAVTFVKVYIATVTHTGRGTGVSNPANGGSVTVENGKNIEITASPDEGNRVLSVTINGVNDKNVSGDNDGFYTETLKANKDYTIVITFSPNVYDINLTETQNGTVESKQDKVEYGEDTTVYLNPKTGYTVDTVSVNGVPVKDIKQDDTGIYFSIENIKEKQNVVASFKKIEKATLLDISIDSDEALRVDDNNTLFVIKEGSVITFSTNKNGIRIYSDNDILGGNETTKTISVGNTSEVSKIELFYKADNELFAEWHIVEMDNINIVVDKGDNVAVSLNPVTAANKNGYYNSDVSFEISAEDTGDYSGLALVEYWITYNGSDEERITLYTEASADEICNTFSNNESIVIDSKCYNSDDIKVNLRAVDRAGNEKTATKALKINSTKPTLTLDINGTKFSNAQYKYYNDARTLTITIVDREDTFSTSNVSDGFTLSKNGESVKVDPSDITWKHNGDEHIGKYIFADDAHYEWNIVYTNIAGLSNDSVSVPEDKNIFDFVVDTKAPTDLKVTYSPSFWGAVLEAATFGFYDAPVTVTIEATDETAGVVEFAYSYAVDDNVSAVNVGGGATVDEIGRISYDGNRAYTTFEIPAQFRGKVSFSATDKAGRTTEFTDNRIVVVDTIAPGVTVEYDNNDVYNGEYYNADRTATIKVTEANFFPDDIKDGNLAIKRTKRLNDGTFTEENLSPEFTKNGDIYTAEVLFDEDADYTFDITYTDRAGNIYDSYPMDEFTIDKINPVIEVSFDNNEALHNNQFNKKRTATIKVTEHNFDKNGISATVDEVSCELKWEQVEGENDVHVAEITFPGDAYYTFAVNGIDKAGNANDGVDTGDSVAPWAFTVDNSGPTGLTVTYEPTFVGTLLENLTFGFYKAPVKVTIEATDETAGIDYFTYTYSVQDGASAINIGKENVKVDVDGTTASTIFEIPAQFRGCVSFVATNNSGVSTKYSDDRVVVVDTNSPSITVEYENNNALNDKYYDADRTATIKINEANFFAQDIEDGLLVITRTTTLNNGEYIEEILDLEFSKDGDVYTSTVDFKEDADYTFGIKYTDRSGNTGYSATIDEFTVDKIQPEISIEQANGAYFSADRTAKITVVEHNFRASDFEFTASACDVTGKTDIDLSNKDYNAYLKNQTNWTQIAADTWEAELTFDIEGNYTIGATYSDLAGNPQVKEIKDTFCVDKTNPENLKITYEPTFTGVLLNALAFGFYDAPVKVTIEATDDISGIEQFVYSYIVEDGASKVNEGDSNVTVKAAHVEETNRAYATFEIPAQFRGNVVFKAIDKASNSTRLADERIVVVDDIAPGISVSYDNNSAEYDSYYRADRTATIVIEEANFFGNEEWEYDDIENGNLVITVEKTLNDGTKTTEFIRPDFVKNRDTYTGTISFAENADYTFDISYTDRSGNKSDSYEVDKFTVDTIKPIINVSYNDAEVKYSNGNQFRTNREATITIIEHNFKASDVVATVTANDKDVEYYAEYLAEDSNWKHNGDVHTAVIEFSDEGHYTFDISYADMASNVNAPVEYGASVSPTLFTIDKSAPVDLDIQIDGESVVGSMDTIAFDKFYGKSVTVKLSAICDISGLDSFRYQKVANASEYRGDATWNDYNDETGIVVNPSEKFIIYFRAEDRAGNVSIIRSTGIVVDDQKPVGEMNAPEIDIIPEMPNINGIHKDDVKVDLKVIDPKYTESMATSNGHYSGLNNIKYKIYASDIDAVEEGVLFDVASMTEGAVFDSDELATSWSGMITIDAQKFNSNKVIVEIVATDNSGNTRTTTTTAGEIKIDITSPTIVVSYDNNNSDSGSFFKVDRTATIKITERNFNAEDVVVTINNTDGVVPEISEFTMEHGTGNEDDTVWTATIKYSADGDYTFDIAYTDLADNVCSGETFVEGTVATNSFTIDKTLPVIEVSYDNNDAQNSNYYKADRTATIVVTEHNFNAERVVITNTATDDGNITDLPTVSGWSTNGDKHTATISYSKDAKYTFDIAVNDKAGNTSDDYTEETFFVDTTSPTLEITGVADKSANNGDVIPVVSYSDTNYDADRVTVTLTEANRSGIALDGYYTDIHNGRTFTFNNFAKEKEIDDIYTLSASLTDKAGNTTEKSIVFSVNRFGSTYAMSDDLIKLNGTFVQKPIDVVITETNADELNNIKITLFKNNETIILTEGNDYKISMTGGNGEWYHYTYTVFAKNFAEDGVYRLAFHSEDASGNVAENTLDTKDAVVSFGIDSTKPNIMVANLENGVTYALENLTVKMSVSDNLMLSTVHVYLDDYNTPYATWTAEEIESILADSGELSFDISGDSTNAHKVKIVCIDAAGNVQEEEITNFFVTTNIWVRYYTNKALFFGSIGGVILLAALIVFLVVYKKKKNA